MDTGSILLSGLTAALSGGVAVLGARAQALRQQLRRARQDLDTARRHVAAVAPAALALKGDVQDRDARIAELERRLEDARVAIEQKAAWHHNAQEENAWLRTELERRPKLTRRTYKVITIGAKSTGKTSLTLKWANPLVDLGTLEGTKIERYQRTVSLAVAKDLATEHVLEIGDWGGEHVVDAVQELILEEIHGMLIVVDLGGKDAKTVDQARVDEQLRGLQPEALKFFFGPRTITSCKTVVLFINKSDLLSGTPAEVEAQARSIYAKLIDDLRRYEDQVDLRVFVGSASYGHSTHLLFAHFVEKILPKNAYDQQLLQRLRTEPAAARPPAPKV